MPYRDPDSYRRWYAANRERVLAANRVRSAARRGPPKRVVYTPEERKARAAKRAHDRRASMSPEAKRALNLKAKLRSAYGLELAEVQQMFANQEGLCAVCSRSICMCDRSGCEHRACVDHDHSTGDVRGLLCRGCNSAIGYAKDSPTTLRNAAGYLEVA